MEKIKNASWIKAARYRKDAAIIFSKSFSLSDKKLEKATITLTSRGAFVGKINGKRIGCDILTPGWTDYFNRLQYFTYNITADLKKHNRIDIGVGKGWFFHNWYDLNSKIIKSQEPALIAVITLKYSDGTREDIFTDSSWLVTESKVRYNQIYNGETLDLTYRAKRGTPAKEIDYTKDILIPAEGVPVREKEVFAGQRLIKTPKGETIIDFGQEITGYVSFTANGKRGDVITVRHFEMLDADGNVYTENYRSAKSVYTVICGDEPQRVKPLYTFYGFRYISVEGIEISDPADFSAIAVYSDMKKTAELSTSVPMLNSLYSNICWGQRGNFLDIPTDCPQRDERYGWTGDAQVFCKTAAFNFDVYEFFRKWCADLRSTQRSDGEIPSTTPCKLTDGGGSAAWADCCTIIPWQMYLTYGKKQILKENAAMMKKWVDYMARCAEKKDVGEDFGKSRNIYLHNNHWHFGDWLSLDLGDQEAASGATDKDLIATAFFAYSTSIYVKTCHVLGKECARYEELYENIKKAFAEEYIKPDGTMTSDTQTAYVLALYFGLTPLRNTAAKRLTELLRKKGHLTTGFVGTPYLLHVLSDIGENELAFDLLLRTEYPSWGYTVVSGGTTMWERWNGKWPDGHFATPEMNSFNHYAYGAVGDWMFEKMAGIGQEKGTSGFESIVFSPVTDKRVRHISASFDSVRGTISSDITVNDSSIEYVFTVPKNAKAKAIINGEEIPLSEGINKIIR